MVPPRDFGRDFAGEGFVRKRVEASGKGPLAGACGRLRDDLCEGRTRGGIAPLSIADGTVA